MNYRYLGLNNVSEGKVLDNDCMIILESYDCVVGTDEPTFEYMFWIKKESPSIDSNETK